MGVHQLSIFGEVYEFVGNHLYKVVEPIQKPVPTVQEIRKSGDACRSCNRYENSDGMYGNHCSNCDCCKVKEKEG
jgi:hypothetical protein